MAGSVRGVRGVRPGRRRTVLPIAGAFVALVCAVAWPVPSFVPAPLSALEAGIAGLPLGSLSTTTVAAKPLPPSVSMVQASGPGPVRPAPPGLAQPTPGGAPLCSFVDRSAVAKILGTRDLRSIDLAYRTDVRCAVISGPFPIANLLLSRERVTVKTADATVRKRLPRGKAWSDRATGVRGRIDGGETILTDGSRVLSVSGPGSEWTDLRSLAGNGDSLARVGAVVLAQLPRGVVPASRRAPGVEFALVGLEEVRNGSYVEGPPR